MKVKGIKPGRTKCNECGVVKNNKTSYQYHQYRITKQGYKMRNSNTCKSCKSNNQKLLYRMKKLYPKPHLNTKCPICRKRVKKWHLDHNHQTDTIRGWLCSDCNMGLGRFKDDYNIVKRAMKWLGPKG